MADSDTKDAPTPAAKQDVVLLGPPTSDGGGIHVLRAREERLEAGELRTVEDGKPISGELLSLAPRKDNPRICDVKESFAAPKTFSAPKTKGPAQIATKEYRDNWDEVFARRPSSQLN